MQRHDKEHIHGQLAIEAARMQGIFPDSDITWRVNEENVVNVAANGDEVDVQLNRWRQ